MVPASATVVSPFSTVPPTIVRDCICPYLYPADLLAVRATCATSNRTLTENDSDEFWKRRLREDFGINVDNTDNNNNNNNNNNNYNDWRQTLQVRDRQDSELSIFGVDPVDAIVVESSESPFACWKSWLKAKRRFYGHNKDYYNDDSNKDAMDAANGQQKPKQAYTLQFEAPYFLRAARIWKRIYMWCRSSEQPTTTVAMRRRILRELFSGRCDSDWEDAFRNRPGIHAAQALFAFSGGQISRTHHFDTAFDGLIGGYQAYGYYSCSRLVCTEARHPDRRDTPILLVGNCMLSQQQHVLRLLSVDVETGHLKFLHQYEDGLPVINNSSSPSKDDVLTWLEYHTRRMVDGEIGIGVMGSHPNDPHGLTLFPRFPNGVSPSITEGIQPVSRAVVRGVEIVGSSVYVPQGRDRLGFIYSIRIRLLTPDDDGYQSPEQRGFQTCQLHTRNWNISDHSTGETNNVAGRGVIGMYPILHEGNYMEGGEMCPGTFQYQSCTGAMSDGSFSGSIEFIPGSINSPSGEPFRAEVRPFALTSRPEFLY